MLKVVTLVLKIFTFLITLFYKSGDHFLVQKCPKRLSLYKHQNRVYKTKKTVFVFRQKKRYFCRKAKAVTECR